MDAAAIGFWGAFFGSVALVLAGALAAYLRSLRRVALMAALSALMSALFVVAYLGWLPIADAGVQARLLAHVAVLSAAVLSLMLLAMLGLLHDPAVARLLGAGTALAAAVMIAAGWLLDAAHALALGSVMALGAGATMLGVCVRSARRGDRLAWVAVSGVSFMLVAVAGLSWIALNRQGVPWPVHAVSAIAATAYVATMAASLWLRYSYLIELRTVLAHGPSYDPLTRMHSHAGTGQMVGLAFFRHHNDLTQPMSVIAISIGNLYTLERLHGRAALNHALFVCASRLRRCVPGDVEMGRLADDGFLLLVRGGTDMQRVVRLGRQLARRLSRPVMLSTSAGDPEAGQAPWVAQVGIGLLAITAQVRPSAAVSMARAMSRTAWAYASRVAWHDQARGQIAELPQVDEA